MDAEAHAKLDRLLAATEAHARRFDDLGGAVLQVVETVAGLAEPLAALREAVEHLADAAGEDDGGGKELARTLAGILDEMKGQSVLMTRIGDGLEGLPRIMEDTALNAATLATGGGAGPRPTVNGGRG
jgi:hypothetical protein